MNNKKVLYVAAMTCVLYASAAMATDKTMEQLECEDLTNAFKEEVVNAKVDAANIAMAKLNASIGGSLCVTSPKLGNVHMKAALYDIGISQSTKMSDKKM